jgi:Holliday junction resolvasome RuvABC endonuclease subunit
VFIGEYKIMISFGLNFPRVATLVGIDPGTQKMGLCALHYDVLDMQIVGLEYDLCKASHLYLDRFEVMHRGELTVKIAALANYFRNYLIRFKPQSVAYETPYISMATPNAFAPLSQLQYSIQNAAYEHDGQMPFYTLQPSLVKTSVGAKGGAGKEDVLAAFARFEPILPFLRENPFEMDHNVIDAICVAYAQFCMYRDSRLPHC